MHVETLDFGRYCELFHVGLRALDGLDQKLNL